MKISKQQIIDKVFGAVNTRDIWGLKDYYEFEEECTCLKDNKFSQVLCDVHGNKSKGAVGLIKYNQEK